MRAFSLWLSGLFLILLGFFNSRSAFAQCCSYTLVMQDSYGDGWNGGSLEVLINQASVGIYSGQNASSSVTFQVCDGDSLELVYTAGDWEEENAYRLLDGAYNLLFQDGPNPTVGLAFITVGNCSTPALSGVHPCVAIPVDTVACAYANNSGFPGTGLVPNCSNYQGSDIWFKLVVPAPGNLRFETDSGNLNDTGMSIWTGDDCNNLQRIACDDDAGEGYFSLLQLEGLPVGDTLYVQIFGYGGATGDFRLCIHPFQPVRLDSSELPIVLINTGGQSIVPDTKIECQMEIKYNGMGNLTFVSSPSNVYSGLVGIEVRGATSSGFPQRPFGFETRNEDGTNRDVSILGMPIENDWVLISHYGDMSLVRNLIAYTLFGKMGNYSVRQQLCEVLVDSVYQGVYLIGEKVKRDAGRVAISKLNPQDTLGDELTGGYILQQNYWNDNNSFQSNYSPIDHPGLDIHYVYEYPDEFAIQPAQKSYIASFVDSMETALYSANFTDTALGYRRYMDVKSFIDYFLVNELARNFDGFKKSIFYHKDKYSKGGKMKAGPVWDFDWAFKNIWGCPTNEVFDGSGWAYLINDCGGQDVNSNGYYVRLLQDSSYANTMRCRYEEYRDVFFNAEYIHHFIDSISDLVQHAQERHFQKWPILGQAVVAPEVGAVATSYEAGLDTLKSWISNRLAWLDVNIPGHCVVDPTEIEEKNTLSELGLFPNPSAGVVKISFYSVKKDAIRIAIKNTLGETVWQEELEIKEAGVHSKHLQLEGLVSGCYLVELVQADRKLVKKLVKM
jgi:hypothetical protein